MNRLLVALAVASIVAAPASAADAIKIGFVNTFSGPAAVIGNDMRDGFNLGLQNLGQQMAGRPVEVYLRGRHRQSRKSASRRPTN